MKTEIHRLSLGFTNCYLIRQEGVVLVDAGVPNKGRKFLRDVGRLSLRPEDISLILLTHGHWDHAGSLREIKELTGAGVAVNYREKDWVEQGFKAVPPAFGRSGQVYRLIALVWTWFVRFRGTVVDLALGDEEFSLEPFGVGGRALHTPGHSLGSMSVLLDTGDAFVGDLAMTGHPRRPVMACRCMPKTGALSKAVGGFCWSKAPGRSTPPTADPSARTRWPVFSSPCDGVGAVG